MSTPLPTFSACFGAAFLLLHPVKYARELVKKMEQHHATAYLVNTGWIGGVYGKGSRIALSATRAIIDAILDGSLNSADYETLPVFNLAIPKNVKGIDPDLLNPRAAWHKPEYWDAAAIDLAKKFIVNFEKYTDTEEGKMLVAAGPKI